jgi:hypothetical protein
MDWLNKLENLNTWTEAHWIILDAITRYKKSEDEGRIGLSLPAMIYNALKEKGWIN